MGERFDKNIVTARVDITGEMVMRYTLAELLDIVDRDVAFGIGSEAKKKCTRVINNDPATLNKEILHFCYAFSKPEMDNLQKYIEELESTIRHLQFEQNKYLSSGDRPYRG